MKLFIQKTNRVQQDSDVEVVNIEEMLFGGPDEETIPGEDPGEISVTENEDDYCVELFMPGFRKSDITIEADKDGIVSVQAQAEEEFPEENPSAPAVESVLDYACSFRLPANTDVTGIEAYYENSVLSILVPKMTEEDPD